MIRTLSTIGRRTTGSVAVGKTDTLWHQCHSQEVKYLSEGEACWVMSVLSPLQTVQREYWGSSMPSRRSFPRTSELLTLMLSGRLAGSLVYSTLVSWSFLRTEICFPLSVFAERGLGRPAILPRPPSQFWTRCPAHCSVHGDTPHMPISDTSSSQRSIPRNGINWRRMPTLCRH